MHILFSLIQSSNQDFKFAEIMQRIKPELSAAMIFDHTGKKDEYPLTKAHATYTFSRTKCGHANYRGEPFFKECPPLEPKVLELMSPYEGEICNMFRRASDHRDIYSQYCTHLRYWNHILDAIKIDLYMITGVPHTFPSIVIFRLCELRRIPIVTSYFTPIKKYRHIFNTLKDPCPEIKNVQERLMEKYKDSEIAEIPLTPPFEEFFQKFRRPGFNPTPDYMDKPVKDTAASAIIDGILKPFFLGKLKIFRKGDFHQNKLYQYSFLRYAKHVHLRLKFLFFLSKTLFSFNLKNYERVKSKFSKQLIFQEYEVLLRYYKKCSRSPKEGENFIYVPLHMQPELSTRPVGGVFGDQTLMVKMLSAHLPKGWQLYVKEHPNQIRCGANSPMGRSSRFFTEMAKLKNVKFMPMDTDTYMLQEKCAAVATVTGTAGFEAINRGKPFLMFGKGIVMYAPGVFQINSNHDCAEAIRRVIAGDYSIQEKDLRIYYKALEECTFTSSLATENTDADSESARGNIVDIYVNRAHELLRQKGEYEADKQ